MNTDNHLRKPFVGPSDALIAIVGQAPARASSAHPALWGCSCGDCVMRGRAMAITGPVGARIAGLAGHSEHELRGRVLRGNLVPYWPGPSLTGKGDYFPRHIAAPTVNAMLPHMRGRLTILLGRQVARAFGVGGAPFLEWMAAEDLTVAVMPHPSGVVRWWNETDNVAQAEAFMREAIGV
jgi:hypothetical protein